MMLDLRNRTIRYLSSVFDREVPPATPRELKLVEELREAFRELPEMVPDRSEPSAKAWAENMNELRRLVLNDDPRKFLRWPVILETMFTGFATYIQLELKFLKKRPDFADRWRNALRESAVGHPFLYPFCPRSSGNLIHHAYHVAQYETCTGNTVENLSAIVEFGGGYGSMCRLIHKLSFSGRYVIFDLPHFSALQKFYLRSLGFTVNKGEDIGDNRPGIYCISDLDQLSRWRESINANSLFIATWSLSETPTDVRDSIAPVLERFSSFLFAYQAEFGEMDNARYFEALKTKVENPIKWYQWPIPHIRDSSYLIGAQV